MNYIKKFRNVIARRPITANTWFANDFIEFFWIFRALPGRRRGGGGLGDTFTTTNAASFGLGGVFGGGKPRSAGIKIGGGTDPMLGK